MKKVEVLCMASLAIAVAVAGCSDTTSPASRTVLVPVPRMSKIQSGPPDSTFNISATPLSQVSLMKFTWDTWVTMEPAGTVHLIAKPKLPGASNAYVESGDADASGIVDHHPGHCVLSLSVYDGYGYLPGFGDCGGPVKTDTLISKRLQTPWILRGQLPEKHYYECSNDTNVCHSVDSSGVSTVRERPIPVTLKKLRVNKQTSRFATHEDLIFTASKSLDSIYIGGGWNGVPMKMTWWQWIGADSTRNPTQPWTGGSGGPGPCIGTESIACRYAPYESGRMIVKAFTGGWEQTSSVTVQCPVPDPSTPIDTFPYPTDSILNDTASDFGLRGALLDALAKSNADSAAGVGAAAEHAGFRHEEGGTVRRWISGPDSGRYFFVPAIDPSATECHVDPLAGYQEIPGSIRVAAYHVHPSTYPDSIYGCKSIPGTLRRWQQYPGGPGVVRHMEPADQYGDGGGSSDDWSWTLMKSNDSYIIHKDGTVFKLPHTLWGQNENNTYHWSAFGNAYDPTKPAGKCTWVKNFTAN